MPHDEGYTRPEVKRNPERSVKLSNGPVRRERAGSPPASAFPSNRMYRGDRGDRGNKPTQRR